MPKRKLGRELKYTSIFSEGLVLVLPSLQVILMDAGLLPPGRLLWTQQLMDAAGGIDSHTTYHLLPPSLSIPVTPKQCNKGRGVCHLGRGDLNWVLLSPPVGSSSQAQQKGPPLSRWQEVEKLFFLSFFFEAILPLLIFSIFIEI